MDSGDVCAGPAAKQRPKASSTKRKEEKQNHVVDGGAASGGESDSPAPTKGKGKGKATRRRKKADQFMEEDIIGGFAFVSFKSSDDLEAYIRQTTVPEDPPEPPTPLATTPCRTPAPTPPPPIYNPTSPLRTNEPPATTCVTVPSPISSVNSTPIVKMESSAILGKKRSPIEELERVVKKEGLLNNCKKTAADILENNKLHSGILSKSKSPVTAAVRNSKLNHNDRKSSLLLVPPLIPNGPTTNPCDWNFKSRLSDGSTHSSVTSSCGPGYLHCDSETEIDSKPSEVALEELLKSLAKGNNIHSGKNGIAQLNHCKLSPTTNHAVVSTATTTTAPSTLPVTTTTQSAPVTPATVAPAPSRTLSSHRQSSSPCLFSPIVREPPKPIPGLSGTRNQDISSEKENTTPVNCVKSPALNLHSRCSTPPSSSTSSSSTTTVTYSQSLTSQHNHCHRASPISSQSPTTSSSSSHHRHRNRRTPTPTATSLHHCPRPPLPVHASPSSHHLPASMFAPPLPPSLTSTPLPGGVGGVPPPFVGDALSGLTANPEILQQELNARFLQDRVLANSFCQSPGAGYLRPPDIHQHMHQHNHNHNHTHQHMCTFPPLAGVAGGLAPPSPSLLKSSPSQSQSPSGFLGAQPMNLSAPERDHKKFEKFDSPPFFRQNMPGFPGMSPLLPGPPGLPTAPLTTVGSGLRGAFQPKSVPPSLHPSQLLSSWRDHDKVASQPTPPSVTPVKKTGKWCAAHVRMAWEIHRHQQSQLAVNSTLAESSHRKSAEMNHIMATSGNPLRPPSSLLPPGVSTGMPPRPGDRGSGGSLIGPSPHSRSPFDTPPPNHPHPAAFLNPAHLVSSPFSRTSPYGPLVGLSSGAFGGLAGMSNNLYAAGRDHPAIPGLTSPQEWNRLHRTPPSFPTPPAPPSFPTPPAPPSFPTTPASWPKPPGLDRDKERESEREQKERSAASRGSPTVHRDSPRDREREVEHAQKRDREMRDHHREKELKHTMPSFDHGRHVKSPHSEQHRAGSSAHSRSRSRSPITNGPSERLHSHSNSKVVTNDVSRHGVKVKEEHRDTPMHVDKVERRTSTTPLKGVVREEVFPQTYLGMPYPPNSVSLLDRSQLFPYMSMERPSLPTQHPGMWNAFDHRLDIGQQRLEMQRELEQREQMLRQMSMPPGVAANAFMEERLREQLFMRDQMLLREHMVAQLDRERFADYLSGKVPPPPRLRTEVLPMGAPHGALYMAQAAQAAQHRLHSSIGIGKPNSSPVGSVGVPPPLIPSSTVTTNHVMANHVTANRVTAVKNDVKTKGSNGHGKNGGSGAAAGDRSTPDKHGERT